MITVECGWTRDCHRQPQTKHWFTNQDVAAQRHSCISISELYDLWLNDIHRKARFGGKLQALVYDILPPATAVTDYAIALKKKKKKTDDFSLVLK